MSGTIGPHYVTEHNSSSFRNYEQREALIAVAMAACGLGDDVTAPMLVAAP